MSHGGPAKGEAETPARRKVTPGGKVPVNRAAARERALEEKDEGDSLFGFGNIFGMIFLALLIAAPMGWVLNQLGLIPGPIGFERGPNGRSLAAIVGRDMVKPLYWLALAFGGFLLQICRPLVPLLLIAGLVWWSWLGLSVAADAGLIVVPISPPVSR